MVLSDEALIRHPSEAEILEQALAGDNPAVNKTFIYLSSSNPNLRQLMKESVHDIASEPLWQNLLSCLAVQCWEDHRDSERRIDQEASQQIDLSIIEVFSQDEYEGEAEAKESVLREALNDTRPEIRYAAAFLLGMRGDKDVIPTLEEILDTAVKIWKVRAVQALGAIEDERCGPPLIRALAMDQGAVHDEAKKALIKLGPVVESAWVEALNHPDSHVRWHAARGLGDPSNIRSMEVLAEGLMDENRDVRWATADALARIGPPAIPATLSAISRGKITNASRLAAYHALHGVFSRRLREPLKPLLAALQSPTGCVDAPAIAGRLLEDWDYGQ